jgi:hypothetical protein
MISNAWRGHPRYGPGPNTVVERIDAGGTDTCAQERVVLAVDRVWKGASEREYVLFQDNLHGTVTERLTKDSTVVRSCLTNLGSTIFTKGVRYIVFASGPVDDLRSMGCSTSRATNDKATKDERRRLDRWKRSSGSDRK